MLMLLSGNATLIPVTKTGRLCSCPEMCTKFTLKTAYVRLFYILLLRQKCLFRHLLVCIERHSLTTTYLEIEAALLRV